MQAVSGALPSRSWFSITTRKIWQGMSHALNRENDVVELESVEIFLMANSCAVLLVIGVNRRVQQCWEKIEKYRALRRLGNLYQK